MKRISGIFAVVFAMVSAATTTQAQVISVQYDSTSLSSGTISAGVIPETIWNSDTVSQSGNYVGDNSSTLGNLIDSTGTASTVTESTINDGYYGPYHSLSFPNPGDTTLYNVGYLGGFLDPSTRPFTLSLTGLSTLDTYSLIIFIEGTANTSNLLSATLGSTTYYFNTATLSTGNPSDTTGYVPATALVASGTSTPVANYVEFTNLSGTSLTATISANNPNGADFNVEGFQLVETAVPEPATCVMALGGFGILFAARRIRGRNKLRA